MLYLDRPKQIYLYLGVIDFRKQLNGLSQIVDLELPRGSIEDSWFVFISRSQRQVKILYWRDAGLCLWQYRLEKDRFELPSSRSAIHSSISWIRLKKFLEGYNIFEGSAHDKIAPKRYS